MAFRNWKQELEDVRPPREIPWRAIRHASLATVLIAAAGAVALWVWPGYLLAKPWQRPGPPPERIALVFASDLSGYLEPCGCTEQRWGGIARMQGFLQTGDLPEVTLLFDVGGATAGPTRWQRIGWETYLDALGEMGGLAANIGGPEAGCTAETLRQVAAGSPVPLVGANVLDAATGRPIVRTHVTTMVHNLRIAVIGVVQPDEQLRLGDGVRLAEPDETLGRLLPKLRPTSDVIVLLAACDEPTLHALGKAHPEIDFILGGRVQQACRQIRSEGACRIAFQANHGQMLGRVDAAIGPDGRAGKAAGGVVLLDNDVHEDADMLERVEAYNAELARLDRQGGLEALGVEVSPPPAGLDSYAGSAACRKCHPNSYKAWARSKHAEAFASLVDRRRQHNPDCVRCHVLDYAAGDAFRGIDETPRMVNVHCENCHTRASFHVTARRDKLEKNVGKLPEVQPASCESCHDCIHDPKFSYDEAWEKIKHGKEPQHR